MSDERPTQPYHCPPVCDFPPPAECTRDDLLDIVARTIRGCHELFTAAGQPYVAAICCLVEQIDLERSAQALRIGELVSQLSVVRDQLSASQGLGDAACRQLTASRAAHQATILNLESAVRDVEEMEALRVAALADAQHQRELAAALAAENRDLRTMAAFDSVTQTMTGLTVAGLERKLNAEAERDRIAQVAMSRMARRRARERDRRQQIPVFDVPDTEVVDIENLDGPAVDRTPTPRVVQHTMAETQEGA